MKVPEISVIMPAFNAGATLAASAESVQKQSFPDWELIVIDDGSSDNTAVIAGDLEKKDARIRLLKLQKNGGLPNARNEGCRQAKGEFIAFLDSDDLWHGDKLQKQLEFHRTHPDIHISHTDFRAFDQHGLVKRSWKWFVERKRDKEGNLFPRLCYRNNVGVLTVMVKKMCSSALDFSTHPYGPLRTRTCGYASPNWARTSATWMPCWRTTGSLREGFQNERANTKKHTSNLLKSF